MYKDLVQELKSKGVLFDKGLTNEEIKDIEKRYNISFPKELLCLYSVALPISNGFYNWRSEKKEDIQNLKRVLIKPIEELLEYPEEIDWNDNWGSEPEEETERKKIILSKAKDAPQMIPVFGHRYMSELDDPENPVFSIHGSDIICYGKDLITYFQTEFGLLEKPQVLLNHLIHVPFWSDFL